MERQHEVIDLTEERIDLEAIFGCPPSHDPIFITQEQLSIVQQAIFHPNPNTHRKKVQETHVKLKREKENAERAGAEAGGYDDDEDMGLGDFYIVYHPNPSNILDPSTFWSKYHLLVGEEQQPTGLKAAETKISTYAAQQYMLRLGSCFRWAMENHRVPEADAADMWATLIWHKLNPENIMVAVRDGGVRME